MKCCICGKEIEGYGNNPDGYILKNQETGQPCIPIYPKEARCCDACNQEVIKCRILQMNYKNWAKKLPRIEMH